MRFVGMRTKVLLLLFPNMYQFGDFDVLTHLSFVFAKMLEPLIVLIYGGSVIGFEQVF